jgi:DNA-binding MarR family transcriptional regulator
MAQDSVDRHVEHWQREIPQLDPLVEGVVTRMQMVLLHLRETRQAGLAGHGLEEFEYDTLHFLGGLGPGGSATPGEIASWLRMSPSGITGRLDTLEKRGFIRRLPSPADRRKVLVELTEAGRQAWLGTFNPQSSEEAKVLAVLEPEEQRQFDDLLRRMLAVFDRPGLLDNPASSRSRKKAATPKSRFTQE